MTEYIFVRCPRVIKRSDELNPVPPKKLKVRTTHSMDYVRWYCSRTECGMWHLTHLRGLE